MSAPSHPAGGFDSPYPASSVDSPMSPDVGNSHVEGEGGPPNPIILLILVLIAVFLLRFAWRRSAAFFPDQPQGTEVELAEEREVTQWSNVFTMFLNGTKITLVNPDPEELLASFIRNKMELKGTKLGCEEGGCGACTVVLTTAPTSASTKEEDEDGSNIIAVNSCLRPLCANDGMSITTVEAIGSVTDGLSEEQTAMVANNGTQCGFCTPGWVTNMYAYNQAQAVKNSGSSSVGSSEGQDKEAYLDGNLCRCTGYKPIIKAFKESGGGCSSACAGSANSCGGSSSHTHSSADCCNDTTKCGTEQGCDWSRNVDVEELAKRVKSINDRNSSAPCKGTVRRLGRYREDRAQLESYDPQPLHFTNPATNKHWYRPVTLNQLCRVLRDYSSTSSNGSSCGAYSIQLVGGNTSIGVTKYLNKSAPYYTSDAYNVYIDINSIPSFSSVHFNAAKGELSVGAGVSINKLIKTLRQYQLTPPAHHVMPSDGVNHASIFSVTANHLHRIAGNQVRNAASWVGNIMTFLKYPNFQSDAVLALTTAGVVLHCCDRNGAVSTMSMEKFISGEVTYEDFVHRGLFILSLTIVESKTHRSNNSNTGYGSSSERFLPPNQDVMAVTFKIAQRPTNAHAHVNAGFNFIVERNSSAVPVCRSVRIVVGGVSEKSFIAKSTEAYLLNKEMSTATLQQSFANLQSDLSAVGINTTETTFVSPEFLVSTMQGCLYRAFLHCYRTTDVPRNLLSAITPWTKPESRGTEVFLPSSATDNKNEVPVGMPIHKLEAKIQSTGQAVYPSDEAMNSQSLFGAFVYASQGCVILSSIDGDAAMASVAGVVAVMTAADIPGSNLVTADSPLFVPVGSEVTAVGQPVALVVATSEKAANDAVSQVVIKYSPTGKAPIPDLNAAIACDSFYNMPPVPGVSLIEKGDVTSGMQSAYRTSKGYISASGQYHFYMEAQAAVASVVDGDCVDVTCGSQDPSGYQAMVAGVLNVAQNKVTVKCPRVGGAFGGKITHGIPAASAASLAATKLKRTVRVFNTRTSDMLLSGGREAFSFDYEVGYTADGVITALTYTMYIDAGNDKNDAIGGLYMGMNWADNAYYIPNYKAVAKEAFTNTPGRTSMRAPGVVQACFATEMVVERIAYELNLPLTTVQERNFIRDGETTILGQPITDCTLPTVWSTLMTRSGYSARLNAAQTFNKNNTWRKRGIAVCPVKYGMGWAGYNAGIRIGIRSQDGTVVIAHSGCEIGQGINTKVVQTVAYALGIDIDLIRCTSTGTDKVVNGGVTGGSGTSEVMCKAALNACAVINERLAPYRDTSTGSRQQPISASFGVSLNQQLARSGAKTAVHIGRDPWIKLLGSLPSDVSLNAEGWFSPTAEPNGQPFQYFVYGACLSEVEMMVLTGEVHVLSSEIVYDCGVSLNPAVDIGQIEGGLVMGLGYFLQEKMQYDTTTAALNTVGTWEYKPPNVQDIPSVFNITLMKNMYNTSGILGSKATGEPPYILANSIFFATKMAIDAARNADGVRKPYLQLSVPLTVDQRQQACMNVDANAAAVLKTQRQKAQNDAGGKAGKRTAPPSVDTRRYALPR